MLKPLFVCAAFATLPFSAQASTDLSRQDWDSYERSWDFPGSPLLRGSAAKQPTLEASYHAWHAHSQAATLRMQALEEQNNRLFIDAYSLEDELTPQVPLATSPQRPPTPLPPPPPRVVVVVVPRLKLLWCSG